MIFKKPILVFAGIAFEACSLKKEARHPDPFDKNPKKYQQSDHFPHKFVNFENTIPEKVSFTKKFPETKKLCPGKRKTKLIAGHTAKNHFHIK
ncbi:MAG: hypothetical protein R6U64_03350 [Bacteroidales bacterium]